MITHALLETLHSSYRSLYLETDSETTDSFLKKVCATAGIEISHFSSGPDLLWDFTQFVNNQYEQKKKIVLVLDNVHQINHHWFREIGEFFRSFISFGTNPVKFVLVGNNSAESQVNHWQKQISAVDIYYLNTFNSSETEAYLHHRLRLVSNEQRNKDSYYYPFNENAGSLVYQYTEGIPLRINRLCQSAIELGYIRRQEQIGLGIIEEVAKQLGYKKSDNDNNSNIERMIPSLSDLS
jgi:predicted ATPase